jgi:rhodanese-related sulfurtransferase
MPQMRTGGPAVGLALLLAWTWFGGCGREAGRAPAGVREVTPAEAAAAIREHAGDPSFVLLDVRRPDEFRREKIAGAQNLDFHAPDFREKLSALDREKTYFLYCRSGNRSAKTLPILRELGFKRVLHLTKGIIAWKDAGFPVEIGPASP